MVRMGTEVKSKLYKYTYKQWNRVVIKSSANVKEMNEGSNGIQHLFSQYLSFQLKPLNKNPLTCPTSNVRVKCIKVKLITRIPRLVGC